MAATAGAHQTYLQRLQAEPKNQVDYRPGETFLLHVFWEAPSAAAAHELLAALRSCANATHRDTPCTTTYCFRIGSIDSDVCSPVPRTAGDHLVLREVAKKLQRGMPVGAVKADMARRRLDHSLLDLSPTAALPEAQQQQPVLLEFTEVYLDERAFMQHSVSRDFLAAYGKVMDPSLQYRQPVTIRLGTPPAAVAEKILEPMLHEVVVPLAPGCVVWRPVAASAHSPSFANASPQPPPSSLPATGQPALLIALDISAAAFPGVPAQISDRCVTCVTFAHPLRPASLRLLCVLPDPTTHMSAVFKAIAALAPERGEVYSTASESEMSSLKTALAAAGLERIAVNAGESSGYVLHSRAAELKPTA